MKQGEEKGRSWGNKINKDGMLHELMLCLPTQKGLTVVKLDEIIYCEAQRSYTLFWLADNRSELISKPLFEYDRLLSGGTFCRIHKSYLINIMHVREYLRGEGGDVIMTNGKKIEVSRRKKRDFLDKIKAHFKY